MILKKNLFIFRQTEDPVPSTSSSRVSDSISDIVKAAIENKNVGLTKKPEVQAEFEKSWNEETEPEVIDIPDDEDDDDNEKKKKKEQPEPSGSSMFLSSSTSTAGISRITRGKPLLELWLTTFLSD